MGVRRGELVLVLRRGRDGLLVKLGKHWGRGGQGGVAGCGGREGEPLGDAGLGNGVLAGGGWTKGFLEG